MASSYTIIDEPQPSRISHLAVNPLWAFFATIFAGASFGLSWFAFNSFAISSAHKGRELSYVALGVVGTPLLLLALVMLVQNGVLLPEHHPYAKLCLTVFHLALAYMLHLSQLRSFELFELHGGTAKNGLVVVIALTIARPVLMAYAGPFVILLA